MEASEPEYINTNAGDLAKAVPAIPQDVRCGGLQQLFTRYDSNTLIVVEEGKPIGYLSYRKCADQLSTQFGYALFQKRAVSEIMDREFLQVVAETKVEDLVHRIMERPTNALYEDIVVVQDGNYIGLLSIARVLLAQHDKIEHQLKDLQDHRHRLYEMNQKLKEAFEDLQKTEAQLLHAEKMSSLGTLAAGIAHDFNNMLGAIVLRTALLRKAIPENMALLHHCDIIEEAASRAANLTKQLLSFSNKGITSLSTVSINQIITTTLRILERSFDRSIRFELSLDKSIPPIEGDQSQLQQVIMNLLLNARDAIKRNGVISISSELTMADLEYCKKHPPMIAGTMFI